MSGRLSVSMETQVIRTRPYLFADSTQDIPLILEQDPLRKRPRLLPESSYTPPAYKGSPFESWARAYIQKNLWRAQCFIDQEDLEQEARVKYWTITKRYAVSLANGAHMMSLFKQSVSNMITDQARKTSTRIKTVSLQEEQDHGKCI
jgi:hypothetical protein